MKKCCKYVIKNVGTELATYNFVKCDDAIQYVQEALFPDEIKEVFCFEDTLNTAFKTIEFLSGCDGVIAPSKTPTPTPNVTPTLTQTPTITPTTTYTPSVTQTMTPTPSVNPLLTGTFFYTTSIPENEVDYYTNFLIFANVNSEPFSMLINWGDNQTTQYLSNTEFNANHIYSTGGTYNVSVTVYGIDRVGYLNFYRFDTGAYNLITEISGFDKLISLNELFLRGNNLTNFDPQPGLTNNLLALELSENQLTVFNPTNPLPSYLYGLNLDNNLLTEFEPLIPISDGILNLGLSGNQIVEFNPFQKVLPDSLQVLNLSNNLISVFNLNSNNKPAFKSLLLQNNQLTSFVSELPNTIETLDLSYNNLTSINTYLPSQLIYLSLRNNQLVSPYPVNYETTVLRILELQNNLITELGGWPSTLPQTIEQLNLSGNQLDTNQIDSFLSQFSELMASAPNRDPNQDPEIDLRQALPAPPSPSSQTYIDILVSKGFSVLVDS